MDQISPPMRIVLAVAVVFIAAYMLVLKPKDEEAVPAPAPATAPAADAGGAPANTSLGKAVEGARDAAAATESAQKAGSGETESSAPSTTQAAPAAPETAPAEKPAAKPEDGALADLPKWLRSSIDKKVVAFLFTNGESADDRRTSRALQKAYTGDNDVVTRVVNVKKISAYQAVAEDLDVSQSPTLMVIARDRTAQAYPGYSSLTSINQAIIDGLLATDNPVETVPFLQTVQAEGKQFWTRVDVGVTDGSTVSGQVKNLKSSMDLLQRSIATIRKADAPKPYRDLKSDVVRYLESERAVGEKSLSFVHGDEIDVIAVAKASRSNDKLMRKTLLDLNAVGVDSFN